MLVAARDRGVLLSVASERVLRFTPPLVIKTSELEEGVRAIDAAASSISAVATEITQRSG
jgi:acetylornithine/succinyldiaminopimelate/putrescine aminotransferase